MKNIIARPKTGNNKIILLKKKKKKITDCLKIPLNRNPHHRETSQSISIVSQLTGL